MRPTRTLLIGVVLVALTACGGTPSSSAAESTGAQPSTTASDPGTGSPAATPGGGGPGATDVEGLLNALVPPNSHQISRTEAGGSVLVAYESTDTVGDLKSFYVQKIAELNMQVLTTTEAANTYAVAFGTDDTGTGLGATVAVQNTGDVSNVVVTVAQGSGG